MSIFTEFKTIYDRLQDEESRITFDNFLRYKITRDTQYLENIAAFIHAAQSKLIGRLKQFPEVVLYGAGGEVKEYINILTMQYAFIPKCVIDADAAKHGNMIYDCYPVCGPDTLLKHKDAAIVLSTRYNRAQIISYLTGIGFQPQQIFTVPRFGHDQYFFAGLLKPEADEVYIDAGTYLGETVADFIGFCSGKYKKIYAFEPNPGNRSRIAENIRERTGFVPQNMQIIPCGAYSHEGEMRFHLAADSSSISPSGEASIKTTAIDSCVGEDSVTLIKMDIEGSELEALKGAQETIRRCKPRLAISVYHKPEDILQIPLYLAELVPEYRFWVRSHKLSGTETVLYAML